MSDMQNRVARGKPAAYDQLIVKRRFRLTEKYLDLDGLNILDFGCGNGAQTVHFAAAGANVTAIDIDESDLDVLKQYISDNSISNIEPYIYDGIILPFNNEQFDAVVSYEVLEHVDDESRALSEIYRVLRKSGKLVISVPNKWWIFETHGANLPLLPWNRIPFFSWLPKWIHNRYAKARIYRRRDILNLLKKHQFAILDTKYITAPMDVVKNKSMRMFLRRYIFRGDSIKIPFMSTAIMVSARKQKNED